MSAPPGREANKRKFQNSVIEVGDRGWWVSGEHHLRASYRRCDTAYERRGVEMCDKRHRRSIMHPTYGVKKSLPVVTPRGEAQGLVEDGVSRWNTD